MRILGLDPATVVTGYGVIDTDGRRTHTYVESGVCESRKKLPREKRLIELGSDIEALLIEFHPDLVALETAKWGGKGAAPGALGEIRGIVLWLCHRARARVVDFAPSQARAAIGVGGGASKLAVAKLVQRVLKMEHEPGPDAGDALGIALACALTHGREDVLRSGV